MGEKENEDIYEKQYGVGDLICEKCHIKIDPSEPYLKKARLKMNHNTGVGKFELYHANGVCDIGQ